MVRTSVGGGWKSNRNRDKGNGPTRPRTFRPTLEPLEYRRTPTVDIQPFFGFDSFVPTPNNDRNYHTLSSPSVYLIFWGSYWKDHNADAQSLTADAQTILKGPFTSGLTAFGSDGRVGYTASFIDTSSDPPPGFDPASPQGSSGAIQDEIARAIKNPSSPVLIPPADGDAIYAVVTQATHGPSYNGVGTYTQPDGSTTPLELISLPFVPGDQVGFDRTFGHELIEAMSSDPSGFLAGQDFGVKVNPPPGLPTNLTAAAPGQIADYEAGAYTYRLGGFGGVPVAPYDVPNVLSGDKYIGDFVVPDGNTQSVFLVPDWTVTTTDPGPPPVTNGELNGYTLYITGAQLFPQLNDSLTITRSAAGLQVTLNGENFYFDSTFTIESIQVDLQGNNFGDTTLFTLDDLNAPSVGNINVTSMPLSDPNLNMNTIDGFLPGPIVAYNVSSLNFRLKGGSSRLVDVHSSSTGDTWTVRDDGAGGASFQSANLRQTIDVAGLEFPDYLNLDTAGDDTVNVQGIPLPLDPLAGAALVGVNLGTGTNVVNITPFDHTSATGDQAQNLDFIRGNLTVNGGAGTNTLTLDDLALPFDSAWDVFGSGVSRVYRPSYGGVLGPPVFRTIYYTGINNLVIDTGTGTNSIALSRIAQNLDELPTSNTFFGTQGSVTVNGSGADTLVLNDQNNANPSAWTVTGNNVSRSYSFDIGPFPNTVTSSINYRGIADLELNAGSGGNTITLSPTAQDLDELPVTAPFFQTQGLVTVNGGGSDTLILDDQNNTSPSTWTVTGNNVTRSHSFTIGQFTTTVTSTIDYSGLAALTLNGGPGGNMVVVQNTAASTNTRVNSGNGVDFVYARGTTGPLTVNTQQGGTGPGFQGFEFVIVGGPAGTAGSLSTIQGPLTVNTVGRPGIDYATMALFDTATTAPETYTLTSNTILRSGAAPIYYRLTNQLEFHLGSGGNVVNIQNTFSGLPEVFVGGVGNDTFNVGDSSNTLNGIQSHLSFQIANPGSQVILHDEGNSADINYTFAHDPAISPSNFVQRSNSGYYILYSGPLKTLQLQAGSGNNTFNVRTLPPSTTAVTLNGGGGGGMNTLDYSQYVGDITVDLPLGIATGLTGGISNIQNVTGSQGNDLIVGDANPNVLIGGTGRNILIGGAGADVLTGGPGEDILIGGSTRYDTDPNLTALNAIMAEWTRTDLSFSTRMRFIQRGGDPNEPYLLNASTVIDDLAVDTLTGGAGRDWFILGRRDIITDFQLGVDAKS